MSGRALNARDDFPGRHAAGWYGKLPALGDFATRGLDSGFVSTWDEWLSAGLSQLRAGNEDGWLDEYLASPTWRFALSPGFLPAPVSAWAWVGVVMPSVDRVGRYYPLTLACPRPALPANAASRAAMWSWLQLLEDAAVDALQGDWSIEVLEAELRRLGLPPDPGPDAARPEAAAREPTHYAAIDDFFDACTSEAVTPRTAGRCVWYSQSNLSAPRTFSSSGMDESVIRLWLRA